jgi:hypothetical protein
MITVHLCSCMKCFLHIVYLMGNFMPKKFFMQLLSQHISTFDQEWLMVKTLQFNMSVPTPYVFMKRFLQAAQSDRQVP